VNTPPGQWQVRRHPAMNTQFVLRLGTGDARKADVVAGACFARLDDLEALLSRYREDSDISRINGLGGGESLLIHEETHACLRVALEMHGVTGGLFDITIGAQTLQKNHASTDARRGARGAFQLDPSRPEIHCLESGRLLDLGGIGKGYALDQMAAILRESDIPGGLLSAGASTHLAIGGGIWPIELLGDVSSRTIPLHSAALSATGTGIQGDHILHPIDGHAGPYPWRRAWVIADGATRADALSTACLLMDADELVSLQSSNPFIRAILTESTVGDVIAITGIP